ncbi:MAG: DsbA family protein [Patescibacteria group bacterium]|nr:DsbA family protein [Patescibacteria group bacterium]
MAVKKKTPTKTSLRLTSKNNDLSGGSLSDQPKKVSLLEKLVPVLTVFAIVLAFVVGILWEKVSSLEKGKTAANSNAQQQANQQQEQVNVTKDQIKKLFNQNLLTFGDKNSKLTFVVVEDPSCPFCHIAGGKNPELVNKLIESDSRYSQFKSVSEGGTYVPPMTEIKKLVDSKKASLVYIFSDGHGNGEMGHKALLCANEKGKFWQAHDLLYSNKGYELLNNVVKNDKSKAKELADFLESAVNPSDMKSCLESGKYDNRPSSEMTIARSLGVSGTPAFFVNTTKFAGAYSYTQMEPAVKSALGE